MGISLYIHAFTGSRPACSESTSLPSTPACNTRSAEQRQRLTTGASLVITLLLLPQYANALEKYWVCGNGSWDTGSCWSIPGQPNTGDNAYLVQSDGASRSATYVNTLYPLALIGNLSIDASGGGSISLLQSQDTLNTGNQYIGYDGSGAVIQSDGSNITTNRYLGFNAGSSGALDLHGGTLSGTSYIGFSGDGTVNQSGGVSYLRSYLGYNDTGTGIYNLTDGTRNGTLDVGYFGIGVFNQWSGSNDISNSHLYLGSQVTGDGSYNLHGGSLITENGSWIGVYGTGVFNQYGGIHDYSSAISLSAQVWLGRYENSTGTYNFHAGTMEGQGTEVGVSGSGFFNQMSGDHLLMGGDSSNFGLRVGVNASGVGSYNMSGGTIATLREYVGMSGSGTFSQSGGSNSIYFDGGNTYYGLYLGFNSTGNGTYNLTDGALQTYHITAGRTGTGEFNQSGGVVDINESYSRGGSGSQYEVAIAGNLWLAEDAGSTGSYNLSDGSLATKNTVVGKSGNGNFNQSGGTHTVDETLSLAQNAGSSGSYTLDGGTLDATHIVINSGAFNFNGGTLVVDTFTGNLVNNGGILAPGDSPGSTNVIGDYSQLAGVFDVEIGGTGVGEYDVLNVSGGATLGGNLDVSFFDFGSGLFNADLGDTFDILFAEDIYGEFDLLNLAALDAGLAWNLDYLVDEVGSLDVVRLSVAAVPLPAAVWLFGTGLVGLISIGRRRKARASTRRS